jgi:hypothetical protein
MSKEQIEFGYYNICPECKKKYGRSRLSYMGIPIYYGCDCMPKDVIYCIDTNKLKVKNYEFLKEK